VRYSLPISLAVHAAILLAAVVVLPRPNEYEVEDPDSIPVDIVSIEELSQRQATAKTPKPQPVEKPKPPQSELSKDPQPQSKRAEEVQRAQLDAGSAPSPPPTKPAESDSAELEKLITESQTAAPSAENAAPVAKPRPRPKPVQRKKVKQLDLQQVAALLNKIDEDRTSPPETGKETGTPQQGAFDFDSGSDARISADELDWLRQKIRECWNPPVGVAEAENLQVHVQIELDRSGSVRGAPAVVNHQSHPLFGVAASAAIRAVLRCQPYDRLPPEKYQSWHSIILNFDPREMFSG
jgi:hypothetical protein